MKTFAKVILVLSISIGLLPSVGQSENYRSTPPEYNHCDFSGRPCDSRCKPEEYYRCDFSGRPCRCVPR